MEALKLIDNSSSSNVMFSQGLDDKLVDFLLERNLQPEKFYLTGFETVAFRMDKKFAVSTVLSSLLLFDKQLLILQSGIESCKINDLCIDLGLNSGKIDWMKIAEDTAVLGAYLKSNKSVSHIVVCEESLSVLSSETIKQIGEIASANKVDIVFVCSNKPMSLSRVSEFLVSYMVSFAVDDSQQSLVVALRSKLVQVEGRSKTHRYDLHHYWQRALMLRDKIIEPMAV